jgi:signal transduction histidine kinase
MTRKCAVEQIARYRVRIAQFCFVFVATAIFLLVAMLDVAAADAKRVLLLHSFGRDFKPWRDYARTFRAELVRQSPWSVEITDQSLLTAMSSDEETEATFVQYLRAFHVRRAPDLLVSFGAPAVAFVQRHRQQLFANTPMLFIAVEQRRVDYSDLTANDTVVAVAHSFPAVFENILRVLPGIKTVAVVNGSSPNEQYWLQEMRREAKRFTARLDFIWYNDLSFEDILKHAATLPPHSAIFWHLMNVDAAGIAYDAEEALKRLYAVASAPIFSYADVFFGPEIVGGPMHSVLEGSQLGAAVAVRILGGEKAGEIKVPPTGFADPKFNWREMQRWGISEKSLPPGSEIHFREPSAWEEYRVLIVATCTVLLLQAGMIGWLFFEHRQRRRSELTAHQLSGRLINAQEEERARVARELHDDVTQRLAVLAIDAARNERNSPHGAAMSSMREGLVRLSEDVQALSYSLHPSILKDLGLIEALKCECDRFPHCPVRLEANCADVPEPLSQDVALCLFRIAQEGLRNVARHAGASRAQVSLRRLHGGLELTVKDNGTGFDPGKRQSGMSLGLLSMRQRAALLGGKTQIESSPGRGTTISVWVPLKDSDASRRAPLGNDPATLHDQRAAAWS